MDARERPTSDSKLVILLVDSNEARRKAIGEGLSEGNVTLIEAADEASAETILAGRNEEFVVVAGSGAPGDSTPGIDGPALLRRAIDRSFVMKAAVLHSTSPLGTDDLTESFSDDGVPFFQLPESLDPNKVRSLLEKLVARFFEAC